MGFDIKPAVGGRVEIGLIRRRRKPGEVKFTRTPEGKINVTGDPSPYDVAEAITRSKAKRAEKRKAIGSEKAKATKGRMRAKLRRLEDD